MKHRLVWTFLAAFVVGTCPSLLAADKPRVLALTDIENEPDDAMSMVRFLTYCNQWDVEGLVATTRCIRRTRPRPGASVRSSKPTARCGTTSDHEPGYPDGGLSAVVIREGRPAFGMAAVGEGMDSPGSELIIQAVDRDDPVRSGCSSGADRTASPRRSGRSAGPARRRRWRSSSPGFASTRFPIRTTAGLGSARHFPALFYIASPGIHAGGAYHYATWSGISGDRFHGRFAGADFSIVDNPWLDKNIRSKGPLGAQYPRTKFLMEGDTPSFLYLIDNGLGNPEHPDWGSWGGRYELYTPRKRKWF